METNWLIPDTSFTIPADGVLLAPSAVTDGFSVAGRTQLTVFTEPLPATTAHEFVVWFYNATGAVWSETLTGSGALGATSKTLTYDIPATATRAYLRTTVAAGANVGYAVGLAGSSFERV